MTAAHWCALLIIVAAFSWLAGMECCWRWYVAPRLRAKANLFGELPPLQPLGDETTQYWDVDVVTRRLEPIGIATIAIRHNQPEARN
jgi:hypothetical protein